MGRLKLFAPLLIFIVLGLFLARGLQLDPKALPSALIDKPLPEFSLPALASGEMLTREDVIGQPGLFNVWATWCISCRVEHPWLQQLADDGVPIFGINYKDDDDSAKSWLRELGDPYRANIVDAEGSLGLDLGVYGAPETYFVDSAGIIRYRHVGVVDQQVWSQRLKAIFEALE